MDDILARFDERQEFELLCRNVAFQGEEKLPSKSGTTQKKSLPFYVVK
jgi:hypothetical protein